MPVTPRSVTSLQRLQQRFLELLQPTSQVHAVTAEAFAHSGMARVKERTDTGGVDVEVALCFQAHILGHRLPFWSVLANRELRTIKRIFE